MSKLRVHGYTISLDGYGAGPNQSLKQPLGAGGEDLHPWMVTTRTFQSIYGNGEGTTGADDRWAAQGFENIGAWIMGRNMFAPSRDRGRMTAGRAGGERTPSTTRRCSC